MSDRTGVMYTDGEFIPLYDQPNIFKKTFGCDTERVIYKILFDKQDEIIARSIGIVKIIQVNDRFVDLELLEVDNNWSYKSNNEVVKEMSVVKDYLQSIGIMYIDWKYDNIGISRTDGKVKLFDFDVSGCVSPDNSSWTIEPPYYFAYKKATDAGMTTPADIDNFAFDNGFGLSNECKCCLL